MTNTAEVHVMVGPDGSLSVAAAELANAGIYAGDPVVVMPRRQRQVRSMLGVHDRGIEFTVENQRAVRAEWPPGWARISLGDRSHHRGGGRYPHSDLVCAQPGEVEPRRDGRP